MHRLTLALLILISFRFFISCASSSTFFQNNNYKIEYFSGGGFTGIESGVTINSDGIVKFWDRKPNSIPIIKDSLKLDDEQIKVFDQIMKNPKLFSYKNNYIGNYTTHLILTVKKNSNDVSFNPSDPPTNMPTIFSDLIAAIKKIKKNK